MTKFDNWLLENLCKTNSKFLEASARVASNWQHARHNKEGLEQLLQKNIIHIAYTSKTNQRFLATCTSYIPFIEIFRVEKTTEKTKILEDIKKNNFKLTRNDLTTKLSSSYTNCVKTWDLIQNKDIPIYLKNWEIDFTALVPIVITSKEKFSEELLNLDKVVHDILKAKEKNIQQI